MTTLDTARAALARAHAALDRVRGAAVEKTMWGSPAGKKRLAKRLAALLPPHKVYCEPFAGSAAVLFEKEPAEIEAINDIDPEIAEAFLILQKLKPADLDRLCSMDWVGDKATFLRLYDSSPQDPIKRLHRFLYVSHFSYGKLRSRSFSPSLQGVTAKTIKRIEEHQPRLRGVKIHCDDYESVIRRYDSPDTVFFLDPPYPGYNVDVGESDFDEDRFLSVLKSLRGKFLITYGIRGSLPARFAEAGFRVRRIRPHRSIRTMRGVGGARVLTTLLVSNFDLVEKRLLSTLGDDWELDAEPADIEKRQPFGTFGGSYHYCRRLLPLLPEHKVYVEPFAGAAALLHAKEPSEREIIADTDPDLVFLHRQVKAMTPERVVELRRRFEWTVSQQSFQAARDMVPKDDLARFYKLVFRRTHARDCRPDGTHVAREHLGSTTDPNKYLSAAERLRNVEIKRQDYRKTIQQFDGPDTFFFIDPPYPGEWFDPAAAVDLQEFIATLSKIRGKFIAVLNSSPENVRAFKEVGHVFKLRVREASGRGGSKNAMRLFCANYRVQKRDLAELVAKYEGDSIAKTVPIIKGINPDDERYVLGIVLEPEVVDAQNDIYSMEEVRQAAHRFMEQFGGLGLQHRHRVNDQVKILESYIAPVDLTLGDIEIRQGTWLMAVRVLSDKLWERVKTGALSGFSIGGTARRVAEPGPQPAEETP